MCCDDVIKATADLFHSTSKKLDWESDPKEVYPIYLRTKEGGHSLRPHTVINRFEPILQPSYLHKNSWVK